VAHFNRVDPDAGFDRPWLVSRHLAVVAPLARALNRLPATTLRVFFESPGKRAIRSEPALSPWGACELGYGELGLASLAFESDHQPKDIAPECWHPLFRGEIKELSLQCSGSIFEQAVWRALLQIPRGQTTSYAAIANAILRPGAARAVGQAVGRNALAWVIPCHRVLPVGGGIGGFRWGSELKQALLQAEGSLLTDV
jgi:O-6-methylguanine DNA methyltransferase